jgi:hypothetical protein
VVQSAHVAEYSTFAFAKSSFEWLIEHYEKTVEIDGEISHLIPKTAVTQPIETSSEQYSWSLVDDSGDTRYSRSLLSACRRRLLRNPSHMA